MSASSSTEAKGPFDAHLTLVNTGRAPVKFDEKQCSMSGQLINSAAKTVWEAAECGVWAGEFGGSGVLLPGARATADVQLGEVALQLCRQGVWHAKFSLQTSAGTVQFAEFPFEVVDTTGCSDSEHVGPYVDPNSIHWTLTPQHGVRLGVAVRGKDAAEPPMVPFSQNSPRFLVPEFHGGEPILLVLYLDDLTDTPLAWKRGPDAFRVVVRASGKSAMLPPRPANPNGSGDVEETVLPHSWRYVQTLTLNDVYDLAPGPYDVNIGTRTLMGDAAGANSPASRSGRGRVRRRASSGTAAIPSCWGRFSARRVSASTCWRWNSRACRPANSSPPPSMPCSPASRPSSGRVPARCGWPRQWRWRC